MLFGDLQGHQRWHLQEVRFPELGDFLQVHNSKASGQSKDITSALEELVFLGVPPTHIPDAKHFQARDRDRVGWVLLRLTGMSIY